MIIFFDFDLMTKIPFNFLIFSIPDWLSRSHFIMLGLLFLFAIAHSGLAALRMWGESKIGARLYRVLFALVSIPLATILIIYFFNHRYEGLVLWQIQDIQGVKESVWILSFISFIFLYPATFNLLEIAAIAKPEVHLYETGIIRISRHPQMVGQVIWCIAHTLWLGTTFTLVTSFGLIAHHLFAVWHGDYRLSKRYGDAFLKVKERTSVIPMLAILDGRQKLDIKEFLRPSYVGVTGFTLLFWWLHPWLMIATTRVNF
ncbi:15-cis-zeta-carotene isomerase [Geminocystis sp. NIES-3708]|nr:15-cis-zeta-carotene isomerase [Geminocystis sp. NIES-3708]